MSVATQCNLYCTGMVVLHKLNYCCNMCSLIQLQTVKESYRLVCEEVFQTAKIWSMVLFVFSDVLSFVTVI